MSFSRSFEATEVNHSGKQACFSGSLLACPAESGTVDPATRAAFMMRKLYAPAPADLKAGVEPARRQALASRAVYARVSAARLRGRRGSRRLPEPRAGEGDRSRGALLGHAAPDRGNLHVRGAEPWAEISNGTEGKFKGALEAFSLNLTQIKALRGHRHRAHAHVVCVDGRISWRRSCTAFRLC